MTNAASEPTTLQPISQPAGTSPTISPARPPASIPSASAAKPQAGTTNISPASSQRDFLPPIPLIAHSSCLAKRTAKHYHGNNGDASAQDGKVWLVSPRRLI